MNNENEENSLHKALKKNNKLDKAMDAIYALDDYKYEVLRDFYIECDSEVVVITQKNVIVN